MSRNMTGGNATYSNTTEVLVSGESTSSTDEEIIKDKKNPVFLHSDVERQRRTKMMLFAFKSPPCFMDYSWIE